MRRNWAGNVVFSARSAHRPKDLAALRALLAGQEKVRAVGAGHSFSAVADTQGVLVSVAGLPPVVEADSAAGTAQVAAGMPLYAACARLRELGLALPVLPSTTHVTVAGACATATHGSGDALASLAGYVREVELLTADGEVRTLRHGEPDFGGAVASLGALGIVLSVTFAAVPDFAVAQRVWEGVPLPVLAGGFDRLMAAGTCVSVFTDWRSPADCWVKRRAECPEEDLGWTGAVRAAGPRHPVRGADPGTVTVQGGVPGPWDERLPHFRAGCTPAVGAESQSEYFADRAHAARIVGELARLGGLLAPALRVGEIRTVAPDPCWLGPGAGGAVAFHFTWAPDHRAVARALVPLEEVLVPLGARPHWGKVHGMSARAVRAAYPRAADFGALRERLDPRGVFGNALVDAVLPAGGR